MDENGYIPQVEDADVLHLARGRIQGGAARLSDLSPPEIAELVHELAAQCSALERQNKELRAKEGSAESRAILQAVIENLPFDFWALGPDNTYILQNASSKEEWGKAMGKRPEEVAGSEENLSVWLANNRRAFAGEKIEGEVELTVGGETRSYYNVVAPIWEGEQVWGILGVNVDVTKRKRAETQLKALNETLEQRVAQRTAESQWRANQLQKLAAQMAQTEQCERRRLAKVLHDGLQQVLVAAKLRLSAAGRRLPDERAAKTIREALDLVDEAISESRSLTKELSPPALYDGGLAAGLEWLGSETEKKYQLPVTVDVAAEMDPDDLTTKVFVFEAARELILNAVKHAHASCLEIGLSRVDDDRLQVVIQDDGDGFDTELMNRTESECGFGLFSIRERLGVIGGELAITSSPREGTRARIIAPCRRTRHAERAVDRARYDTLRPPAPERATRIRVLLADDHPVLRKGLADMLLEHPDLNLVGEAGDGQEALELALRLRPDVVLMDITMPRMDGIEATRQIKQAAPEVRVVGLSMHETSEMVAAMKNAGASEYVTKSAPVEDLISSILHACPRA